MTTALLVHDRRDGLGIGQVSSASSPSSSSTSFALHMPHPSTRSVERRARDQSAARSTHHHGEQQRSTSSSSPSQDRRSSNGSTQDDRRQSITTHDIADRESSSTTMMRDHPVTSPREDDHASRFVSSTGRSANVSGSSTSWAQPSGSGRPAAGMPMSPSSSSPNATAAVKRSYSQRSPSRPRSQQGSQAAQIASIKEAERENAAAEGRFVRRHDDLADDEEFGYSRKAPRLARASSPGRHDATSSSSDWQSRRGRRLSQISESADDRDPTLPKMRSSRDDEGHRFRHPASRDYPDDPQTESNYTWHYRSSGERGGNEGDGQAADEGDGAGSPPSRFARLAPLSTARMPAPSSAPSSALAQPRRPLSDSRTNEERATPSPPPRLPGISALGPYHGTQRRQSITSPGQQAYQQQHQMSGLAQGGAGGRQRVSSFGMPAFAGTTSPRGGPAPSSMSALSPSLSQASHTTPGQAFIHPSLAGLPGAGGGAGSKQQPSFVSKLYSMLEDDTIEEMIAWTSTGTTFSVANPAEFARVVLPNWFKHSNWQSFVRQLNMYGFHKVNHTYQGTPEEEIQVWEFKHPSFRRGEVHLLGEIKRKSSRHKRHDSISRSMTHGGEYDMMGQSPSPEMGGGAMHATAMVPATMAGGMTSGHHGGYQQPHSSVGQQHPALQQQQQQQHHNMPTQQQQVSVASYGRGLPASASSSSYRDYNVDHPSESIAGRHARSHSHLAAVQAQAQAGSVGGGVSRGVDQWTTMAGPSQQQSLAPPPPPQHHQQPQQPQHKDDVYASTTTSGITIVDGVNVRLDDLSDRVDAIIRHATYLEGQLRTVSEQLFHSQQNESSLRTHVHHLESQMRSLSDQLYQQRGGGGGGGGGLHPVTASSPSSSSIARMQQHGGGSTAGSPTVQGGGGAASTGRFPPSALAGTRSPVIGGHPNYGAAAQSRGGPLPPPPPQPVNMSSASSYEAVRGAPASSADAYTKLGPPPPRSAGQQPPMPKSEHHHM